ncbi:hypothetical protein SBA2_470016 [Acidobacteriia bacterium SbA2]|nr:hypothetical protein SBA2_470016 [Acidobacteriia bacterium SbA2]
MPSSLFEQFLIDAVAEAADAGSAPQQPAAPSGRRAQTRGAGTDLGITLCFKVLRPAANYRDT